MTPRPWKVQGGAGSIGYMISVPITDGEEGPAMTTMARRTGTGGHRSGSWILSTARSRHLDRP